MTMKTALALLICLFFMPVTAAFSEPISTSEREVKSMAAPIVKAAVESYNSKDYAKVAMYFSEAMFSYFPQAKFDRLITDITASFGRIDSYDFMGSLTQGNNTVALYKAKTENSELLIKLVLTEENGKTAVSGLWFE